MTATRSARSAAWRTRSATSSAATKSLTCIWNRGQLTAEHGHRRVIAEVLELDRRGDQDEARRVAAPGVKERPAEQVGRPCHRRAIPGGPSDADGALQQLLGDLAKTRGPGLGSSPFQDVRLLVGSFVTSSAWRRNATAWRGAPRDAARSAAARSDDPRLGGQGIRLGVPAESCDTRRGTVRRAHRPAPPRRATRSIVPRPGGATGDRRGRACCRRPRG